MCVLLLRRRKPIGKKKLKTLCWMICLEKGYSFLPIKKWNLTQKLQNIVDMYGIICSPNETVGCFNSIPSSTVYRQRCAPKNHDRPPSKAKGSLNSTSKLLIIKLKYSLAFTIHAYVYVYIYICEYLFIYIYICMDVYYICTYNIYCVYIYYINVYIYISHINQLLALFWILLNYLYFRSPCEFQLTDC